MTLKNKLVKFSTLALAIGLVAGGCQKLERPELKTLILDPEPPAYNDLKSFWAFENNLTDGGENALTPTGVGVTYGAGITGQAVKIGSGGYILLPAVGDTVRYPNEFVGLSADTLRNLGSYTLSFWMNGVGPVVGGAQGLFSISHGTKFWGNLDMFLENNDNGSEAYLKVHMFNAGVAAGNGDGEQWNEVKIPNALNAWTHIVVEYDGITSQFSIYANGQPTSVVNKLLEQNTVDHTPYGKLKFNNFNGMVLGTYQFQTTPSLTSDHGNESWARSFNGSLDQFRLYNRALSAAEITELYTSKR